MPETPDSPTTIPPRVERPAPSDASPWRFPAPSTTTLPNGLQVWVFDLPGQHVAALELVQPIALDAEPRHLEGVGTLTLRCSDEGTLDHPHGRISELLENVGAVYGGTISHAVTTCTLDVPVTRFAQALPLFADIVQRPDLSADDLTRHQALRQAEIEQTLASGPGSAALAMRRVRWRPEARSSRPSGGDPGTVAALTRETLLDFHRNHWGPQGSVLVVGGDFSADPLDLIGRHFSDWRSAAERRVEADEHNFSPLPDQPTVHLVDRPDAVQIDLRIGGTSVDRHDPDWPAMQAASLALGGSFLSRLNKVIREERGYTYGIHLAAQPQRRAGTWTVSASIRTDVAVEAIGEVRRLLDVTIDPLREDEIADATSQLVGLSPLRNDTAEAVVSQASTLAMAGFEADQVNRHHEALRRVTAISAQAAASRIMGQGRGHLVVVGNAEELSSPLQAAGYQVQLVQL